MLIEIKLEIYSRFYMLYSKIYINQQFMRNHTNTDSFMKKKEEYSYNIRRTHRDEKMRRRRNQGETGDKEHMKHKHIADESIRKQLQEFMTQQYKIQDIPILVGLMRDQNIINKHHGAIGIRKLLCSGKQIYSYIQSFQLLQDITTFAQQNQYLQLKLQGAWIIANLLHGNSQQCAEIVKYGVLDLLVEIVKHEANEIAEQGLWGLGNLAADNTEFRDSILNQGGMIAVIKKMETAKNQTQLKVFAWAISNLCRGQPPPNYDLVKIAVKILGSVVNSGLLDDENQTLSDCLWALSYLSDGQKIRLQRVLQTGVLPKIAQLSINPYPIIYVPALRILGNCSASNEFHTNALLQTSFLDYALQLLDYKKNIVRREVAWILSNIAAGTEEQAFKLIIRKQLVQKLYNMLKTQIPEIKLEICWIFINLGRTCDPISLVEMYRSMDLASFLGEILNCDQSYLIVGTLQMIYKFLVIGEKASIKQIKLVNQNFESDMIEQVTNTKFSNKLRQLILDIGIGKRLEQLQHHEEKSIYQSTSKILERFFEIEQDNN